MMARALETIKLFQYHNLKTSLLVCNGDVPMLLSDGAYSMNEDQSNKFEVEPWMINLFKFKICQTRHFALLIRYFTVSLSSMRLTIDFV